MSFRQHAPLLIPDSQGMKFVGGTHSHTNNIICSVAPIVSRESMHDPSKRLRSRQPLAGNLLGAASTYASHSLSLLPWGHQLIKTQACSIILQLVYANYYRGRVLQIV